jgi:cation transport regulator ChaC
MTSPPPLPDDSWYFAYGSNLDPVRKEDRTGGIREARSARLRGFRFAFNKKGNDGSGKANIVSDSGGEVWGVVYRCSAKALAAMDRMEGVPDHYERQAVEVVLDSGESIDAITYVANPHKVADGLMPTRDYLKHVLQGIRHHQLPNSYLSIIQALGSARPSSK